MGGASRFIVLLTTPFPLLYSRRTSSLLRLTRHSHRLSLASLSTSHHHHLTLSPTSPPQLVVFPPKASQQIHTQTSSVKEDHVGDSIGFSSASPPRASHPWPEWSKLVDTLSAGGYFDRQRFGAAEVHGTGAEDAFVVYEDLPEEFVCIASACLLFARDQPNLLGSLSRRDIEVTVENGTPFLFRSALDTARRMRSFLGSNGSSALEFEKALMVDLMKYLLSYASNPTVSSDRNNMYNGELVESSVRNLLSQLAEMSYRVPESGLSSSAQYPLADGYGQSPRPLGPKIEMKRGDWICPRCTFMNFARNMKCLECEEARPKRQLTGGEWECPQCDFFNYGRNTVCLRCDCKRPGEASFSNTNTGPSLGYNSRADVDSRLAANEEKAQRWFSNVSLLDDGSDLSRAAADEDFPEIMPLRKGENRFVVSTRKTPLERRLENSQYRRNMGNDGSSEDSHIQTGGPNETLDTSINRNLDEIFGHKTTVSDADNKRISSGENAEHPKSGNSSYVPFVPLPSNMFAKKPENLTVERSENVVIESLESLSSSAGEPNLQFLEKPESPTDREEKEKQQAEKSERWFKKVAELHDVTDLASAISDEDFPEIMPMRKGENRFVVSKKKDRSMTNPMYKRRMALEQSGNSNFVPFVPFPPDYFAKKEKQQPDGADSTVKAEGESPPISAKLPEKSGDARPGVSDMNSVQRRESQESNIVRGNSEVNGENVGERKSGTVYGTPVSGNRSQNSSNFPQTRETSNVTRNSPQPTETHNVRSGWTGKSLEGSAVKEIDPLDMSEEAKAERWFRRVAQIKDISELSQIPDEDFPSIMPMRKGVNRFVVSKRKTPLERRLTSPQYRRNLPIVNSEPMKKEDDKS